MWLDLGGLSLAEEGGGCRCRGREGSVKGTLGCPAEKSDFILKTACTACLSAHFGETLQYLRPEGGRGCGKGRDG